MTDIRSELAWLVERFNKYLWCVEHEWGGPIEEYKAEEARAEAILSMTDWQLIETAPKDGTRVIIGEIGDPEPEFARFVSGGWRDPYGDKVPFAPTHWMPLPDPPKD